MIKKAQNRFILITLFILLIIFIGITSTVYFTTYAKEEHHVDMILDNLLHSPTNPGPGAPPNGMRESRSFVARLNKDHEIIDLVYDRNFFTEETVQTYIQEIIKANKETGSINSLFYRFLTDNQFYKVAAIERNNELEMLKSNLITILIVEVIGFVALMVAAYLLSYLVVKPLRLADKKQKSFISDAGHEFKTPLAILSSNAEVLKNELGKNKWLDNILDQTEHMNHLITELLTLSIFEENDAQIDITNYNISEIIENEVLSFEALAYESHKIFEYEIQSNLQLKVNEGILKQLVQIFLDNAIKHASDNGKIKVTLVKKKHIELTFWNEGSPFEDDDISYLFQRFYKVDTSRNQNKSFGLGLSIAKNICDHFNYDIIIDHSYQQYTLFTIIFKS